MSNCNCRNRICSRAIFSTAATLLTIDGADTFVYNIPIGYYANCGRYCLFLLQEIPATVPIGTPVAISIVPTGGVATTLIPLVGCNGAQLTVKELVAPARYCVRVSTVGTGSFRILDGMRCCPTNAPAFLPTPAATAAATPAAQNAVVTRSVASPTATTTTAKKASTAKTSTVDTMTVNASNVTVNKEDK